jgi:TatD family-associated radical SAM protein
MFLYEYRDGLYLNITNLCPTACAFCIKKDWGWDYRGQDLRLGRREPTVAEIVAGLDERLRSRAEYREMVFCGYGEPTMRMEALNSSGLRARKLRPGLPLRLNTVGLGSLVHERDIVPDLARYLDAVSVSVNTADPEEWVSLHRPRPEYRAKGFAAVREFIERCLAARLDTRVTAVERPGADLDAVRAYARALGADFLVRPALEAENAARASAPKAR